MTDQSFTNTNSTGVNLRANVLLAADTSVPIGDDSKASPTPDLAGDKHSFWQNVINFREKMSHSIGIEMPGKSGQVKTISGQIGDGIDSGNRTGDDGTDEDTGDAISELIGHMGRWQLFWSIVLIMFQVPSSFQIFVFMFQVSECVVFSIHFFSDFSRFRNSSRTSVRFEIKKFLLTAIIQ